MVGAYLKRISITGFKSFANKTVIELEPGITAVVGPNGSGKSNVADAIRWALGEQSKIKLRLSDRDEVVFAGSEKRARASMAEVALVFDNSAGVFELELSEVEVSRRLYRNGESEYRLAGRPVRLADLQLLLASAHVGAASYAVVGQGMIDSILLASPSERKLLFDDASGIRADELKREAALKRLAQTETNLTRLGDILREIEPRLAGLARLAEVAKRREALEAEVAVLQGSLIATAQTQITAQLVQLERNAQAFQADETKLVEEVNDLERELAACQQAAAQLMRERQRLNVELARCEGERETVAADMADYQVRQAELVWLQQQMEQIGEEQRLAKSEVRQLERQRRQVERELEGLHQAIARSEAERDRLSVPVATAQADLMTLRRQADDGTQQQYVSNALSLVKVIAQNLTAPEPSLEQMRLLVHKTGRLLSRAASWGQGDWLRQLEAAQRTLEAAMNRRESVQEHIANVTLSAHSLELDLGHYDEQLTVKAQTQARLSERQTELTTKIGGLSERMITTKALDRRQYQAAAAVGEVRRQLAQLETGDASSTIAELATRLERAKATLAQKREVARQTAAVSMRLTSELAHYRKRAEQWQVSGQAKASTRTVAALEQELIVLQTRLEQERSLEQEGEAEYSELKQRYDELTLQVADLTTAQRDLQTVVVRLEEAIKANFAEAFAAISQHFSRYFSRLLEGGQAKLQLVTGADQAYGIELTASPKGKRLTNINALSGGERALTGVALLAAILATNPSPFIVLDEIDAALDESNSGRLAGILHDLNEHSQLIVITHNRQTMAAAESLFGVTLGENQVSRLLSLRLEAARELAAR